MPRPGACSGDHTRVRCTRRCERAGAWADVVRMVRKRAVRAHARTGSVSKTIVRLLMRGLSMCGLSKADLARWARAGERNGDDAGVPMDAGTQAAAAACTHGLQQQAEQPGTIGCLHATKCQQQCRQQWQQPCAEERGRARDGCALTHAHQGARARRQHSGSATGSRASGIMAFGTLLRSGGFGFSW